MPRRSAPPAPTQTWEEIALSQGSLSRGDSSDQKHALCHLVDGTHVAMLDKITMFGDERRILVTRLASSKDFFVRDAAGQTIHSPDGQVASGRHKVIMHGFSLPDGDEDNSLLAEVGMYYRIANPADVAQPSSVGPTTSSGLHVISQPLILVEDIDDNTDVDDCKAAATGPALPPPSASSGFCPPVANDPAVSNDTVATTADNDNPTKNDNDVAAAAAAAAALAAKASAARRAAVDSSEIATLHIAFCIPPEI